MILMTAITGNVVSAAIIPKRGAAQLAVAIITSNLYRLHP
jgi:hypothetical protein